MDFIDLYQHHQIKQTHRIVAQQANVQDAQRADSRHQVDELHDRIDRLTLLCESLWQLVMESSGYTEDDLNARWNDLDMEDGQQDGRRRKLPKSCACGAMVHPRLRRCQYCGADAPDRPTFDRV